MKRISELVRGRMASARVILALLAALCWLAPSRASAQPAQPFASPAELSAALDALAGADLVVLADPTRQPSRFRMATRVAAPVTRVRNLLLDLAAYRSALPSLRQLAFENAGQPSRAGEAMVAWELEVPLWNLDGKLWLQPTPTGADIVPMQGDFAPGLVRLSAWPESSGTTLLTMEASANLRDVNWITRRMLSRSAAAEPAMAAAAFYVMLRALRLQAEAPGAQEPRRHPVAEPSPPELKEMDASRLGRLPGLKPPALLAAVRSRSDGRLHGVQVLALSRLAPESAAALVNQGQTWQALPGWRKVAPAKPGKECKGPTCWKVETVLPLLDLDAIWRVESTPWRAQAVAGDCQGAIMGLDIFPAKNVGSAVVLSIYPRLEKTGYVARKSIESEPLLEHGLALGLGLVDALGLARALDSRAP
jgi:hypothetical protein